MNFRARKYRERVATGTCVRCGHNPKGKTLRCDKCNRRQMRYLHRSRGKLPREAWEMTPSGRQYVAMSVEEIAAALQWPVAEVRFTLMSAIAKVRSQFHDL